MATTEERWSSNTMPPARQLHGFQEVFDRTHFHWGLKSDATGGYRASIHRRAFGDYVFTDIVADPITGFRSMDDIKRGSSDYFCLLFFDGGRCQLQQGHNESVIHPGTIALWDSTRPAAFANDVPLSQRSILIPHRDAKALVPGIEDMCGLSVDGSVGLGAILLSHLKQVHQTIEAVAAEDRAAVLRATVELVAAAFRPRMEHAASTWSRRALLTRVKEHILTHLGDPELTPATIAAVFRFSPRYLHRLFEEFEVTVGGWIRQRRLFAARADLSNSAAGALSITQIAMRHGFADASHFSHAFKSEFRISPSDFRRNAREGVRSGASLPPF